jgi:hypothetical protein
MTEQEAIEQLSNYKRLQARLHLLSNYSVGAGITVSRLNEDDQLQELHRRLRGLPSYMYLSEREQRLETVAHTYLVGKYPSGIQSQQRAVGSVKGYDDEDTKLLRELKGKIAKVVAARGYDIRDDIDAVLERVAELQDIQIAIKRIDDVLLAVKRVNANYNNLLMQRYINELPVARVCEILGVSESTYRRWHSKAIQEYIKMNVK